LWNIVLVGFDLHLLERNQFELALIFFSFNTNMVAALSPWDTIGSQGARNFMLCKKPQPVKLAAGGDDDDDDRRSIPTMARKGNGSWRAWLNKSLNLKISSH
jgi:hypothetical protein